jgi:hypothetical protein
LFTSGRLDVMSARHSYSDLAALVDATPPFLTACIPTPSDTEDARHQFEVRWKNVRSQLSDGWTAEQLEQLDADVSSAFHGEGAALFVISSASGRTRLEFLDEAVDDTVVHQDSLPRLAMLLAARQRAVPHLVVETDRAGADLTALDGGDVVGTETVEGSTLHIHRGHPGGWSQRRFQQRAENAWDENAREVAQAVEELAREIDPALIAVAGEVRAVPLVVDALPAALADRVSLIEAGTAEGVAEEVARQVADHVARVSVQLIDDVKSRESAGSATTTTAGTLDALEQGRVDTLLVNDDDGDGPTLDSPRLGFDAGTRVVDVAIAAAMRTDAEIRVVPNVAAFEGPLAAVLRW